MFYPKIAAFAVFAFLLSSLSGEELPPAEMKTVPTGTLMIIDDPAFDPNENTPRGSTAYALSAGKKRIQWTPSPDPGRVTRGAALIDAAISPDESVLMVAERVGAANGPNSTRLVFFNLFNHKLINAFTVKDRKLAGVSFLPGGRQLLAIQEPQTDLEQPARLLLLNLIRGGEIMAESAPFNDGQIISAVSDGENCFVSLSSGIHFFGITVNAFEDAPKAIRTGISAPRLLLSPDNRTLLCIGGGRLERFTPNRGGADLLGVEQLEKNFSPELAVALNDGATKLVLADAKHAVLFENKISQSIHNRPGKSACCRLGDGSFFLAQPMNEASAMYRFPALNPEMTVSPGRQLRPFNKNEIFRILPLSGEKPELLLIDHCGNLSRLWIKPRRWEKKTIYPPQ